MDEAKLESTFDIEADEAVEARLDEAAEADYREGRVIAHERLRAWLARLAKGERVPPPSV